MGSGTRPAVTPTARVVRDAVQAALREGGLPEAEVARAERLISTAVLGFAASEASGRFRQHDQSVIDADFAELPGWAKDQAEPAKKLGEVGVDDGLVVLAGR